MATKPDQGPEPPRMGAFRPVARSRPRWPRVGWGQKPLLLAVVLVLVGSCLTWIVTPFTTFSGLAGPGVWTLYFGFVGLGGAIVNRRWLATGSAAAMAIAALSLPAWQTARLFDLVGGPGSATWIPGVGLMIVLGGGFLASFATFHLYRGTQ